MLPRRVRANRIALPPSSRRSPRTRRLCRRSGARQLRAPVSSPDACRSLARRSSGSRKPRVVPTCRHVVLAYLRMALARRETGSCWQARPSPVFRTPLSAAVPRAARTLAGRFTVALLAGGAVAWMVSACGSASVSTLTKHAEQDGASIAPKVQTGLTASGTEVADTTTTPTSTSTTTTTTTATATTTTTLSSTTTVTKTAAAPPVTTNNHTTTTVTAPPTSPAANSSSGVPWWGWVLIALGAVAVAIGLFLLGRGSGGGRPNPDPRTRPPGPDEPTQPWRSP